MKIKYTILALLMSLLMSAQEKNKKETFLVSGNCGMCESRIEKAAIKVKGVKYASWDIQSNELTIIFNERKCQLKEIKKAIAEVGHDTEEIKASDENYEKLPACCLYRDPKSKEMMHPE
ncbi:heavy-metal-associated domain-containing protein [Galbibacter mesophilus]|uniref:heavy-metal-associated domain-containing protein n=1 Tax=Galbibacter mesophilus TaxID=379069 RepID=UPI00191CC4F5|nr:heavy-metal-associated domain-containing protein [Galbibacter mesophilus]MCM5663425.1 cation transporter [Galbibacter mesophilus]